MQTQDKSAAGNVGTQDRPAYTHGWVHDNVTQTIRCPAHVVLLTLEESLKKAHLVHCHLLNGDDEPIIYPESNNPDQGWDYRIEKLSNADISDFSVYRKVYRIKPPISSISIISKPVIFLSFIAENSKKSENSPKIPKPMNQNPQHQQQQQQHRKIQNFAENSETSPKIP